MNPIAFDDALGDRCDDVMGSAFDSARVDCVFFVEVTSHFECFFESWSHYKKWVEGIE